MVRVQRVTARGRIRRRWEGGVIEAVEDVNMQECKDFDTVKVRFFPNGTCDEMTLILRSKNNEWRRITLEITTALPIPLTDGHPMRIPHKYSGSFST